jgi:dTDP-4-dehydrorhamnose reductase
MSQPSPLTNDASRPRILLIGASGQVGWELLRSLQPIGEVIATQRGPQSDEQSLQLDLCQFEDIRRVVRAVQPHVIVNAAAYTAVDAAETDADTAWRINRDAPRVLAEEAARAGAVLVHYSTDYVFAGDGQRPWREDGPTAPLNHYGRTKLAGEEAIRAAAPAHLVLRTSWVYGAHGANFVKTMLRLGAERDELSIVNDQFGSPTSARAIADGTAQILVQGRGNLHEFFARHGGTYHLACQGETTWYDFAVEIFRLAEEQGLFRRLRQIRPIPSTEYKTAARRPKNSRLDCARLERTFGVVLPQWRVALEQCMEALHAETRRATMPQRITGTREVDLDIGVIYTHERYWLPRLLSSMSQSGHDVRLRLLLVDNASKEGVSAWEHYFPDTTVLRNERRLGYAENLNRILNASTAPFVLLLNTDMSFDPEEQCLSKMVRFMRATPRCGVAGCRLYHPDGAYGHPARRFQTAATVLGRRTPLAPFLKRATRRYLYLDQPQTATFDCDWLSGCFLLVRREAYKQVGGFDCRFRKYFEDVDFCHRMARAGWRVMFNGETYCYHYEQRASKRLFSRDGWLHLRSYARWLRKRGLIHSKGKA